MGKPSMFSNNYQQQIRRRRLNKFLFILLIICIVFFSGKYYLNKNDIYPLKNIAHLSIGKHVKVGTWWKDLTKKFKAHKKTDDVAKSPKPVDTPVPAKTTTTQAINPIVKKAPLVTAAYTYMQNNIKFNIIYQKTNNGVIITGFNEPSNTSEYCISQDKSKLVFDIKSTSSLISCDSTGKFTDITRPFYKTRSTGSIISKDEAMSSHQGYIWAEKPYFTLDGRVVYVSRLPYIRSDSTLYLWSENVDGTDFKNISMIGKDLSVFSYGGYDPNGKLIVKINGTNYYLDKGSYMLRR